MTEAIKEFTTTVFGSCPWLGVLLIAMVPIIELRGAIPFAMSVAFWGANALPWWFAFLVAVLGSTLPALVIIPALKPVFSWMKKTKTFKKIALKLESKFLSKSNEIIDDIGLEKKKKKILLKKFIGVLAFVAVPLPLTGAWTGSAIAAYLNMPFSLGVLSVFLGNIIAGIIMTVICMLFPGAENIIMYCFLGLALIVILSSIIWSLIKKKLEIKAKDESEENDLKNSNAEQNKEKNDSI